ncbi:hypothetical protein [Paenibacillus sp. USDA918EY]|uniref:hypothetical protein n=1 Tax=Paenibacillus sp. USDA918EY TaxID=2689575 RepID=UPI001F1CDABC|nr:hypothetical protein [Paenibacillus sp. USDA918EY]
MNRTKTGIRSRGQVDCVGNERSRRFLYKKIRGEGSVQSMQMKLEAYINKYLELWDFYGVIQVIQKGKVLFEKAYGGARRSV